MTIDEEMLPGWAANNGLGSLTVEQARTNETVLAEIQGAVDEANKAVSKPPPTKTASGAGRSASTSAALADPASTSTTTGSSATTSKDSA